MSLLAIWKVVCRTKMLLIVHTLCAIALRLLDTKLNMVIPEYGYIRWSTSREAPHVYKQPEGIRYLVRVVFNGWYNFASFSTKI